jgi:hypothetical protein
VDGPDATTTANRLREELRVQTMRMAQFYAPLWFAILYAKPISHRFVGLLACLFV